MDTISFRPRRIVLLFWILAAWLVGLVAGGVLAGVFISEQLNPALGFVLGWIPLSVIASTYLTFYFFSIIYELDKRYVTKTSGVLWKKGRSIPLEKVTNIDVRRGPIERMLGYGTIGIFTPSTGANTPEEELIGVNDPYAMKQTINERSERVDEKGSDLEDQSPAVAESESALTVLTEIRDSLRRIEDKLETEK